MTGTLGSVSTFMISTDQDNLKGIEVSSGPTHIFSILLQAENIMSKLESGRQDYTCMSLACISLYGNG